MRTVDLVIVSSRVDLHALMCGCVEGLSFPLWIEARDCWLELRTESTSCSVLAWICCGEKTLMAKPCI